MSNAVNRVLSYIVGSRGSYHRLDSPSANSTTNIPGGFPGDADEPIVATQRNRFNSHSVHEYAQEALKWIQYLIIKPIIVFLVVIVLILGKILQVVFFKTSPTSYASLTTANDPVDKVNRFICELEDQLTPEQQHNQHYGNGNGYIGSSLPPFYQGSYSQALYTASSKAKFLYIFLTNSQNENSTIIFKSIITHPSFLAIFQENPDALIWGGDLTNPEAHQLANGLNVTKFPFVGLMCLTRSTNMTPQGPLKTTPKISLILKIQGGIPSNTDPAIIIDTKFTKRMKKYDPELVLIRNELRDKFMNAAILKLQDYKYQQSLAKDKAKKMAKANALKLKEYLQWRIPYFKRLLRENTKGEEKARIAIKMKNGERKTLYFPSSRPVKDIFEFTELCQSGLLDENLDQAEIPAPDARFESFQPDFKFKLVSPLPPKVTLNDYLLNDAGVLIRDIDCVYPNGLLIVEDQ